MEIRNHSQLSPLRRQWRNILIVVIGIVLKINSKANSVLLDHHSPYKINQELAGGRALMYGDVVLSPKQLKFRRIKTKASNGVIKHIAIKEKTNNRWPNNEIPFIFSEKYNAAQKSKITDSFKTLEANSCFKFLDKNSTHQDYLFIDMLDGCFSFVGKIGGRQLLSLAAGCLYDYIIWHEVMHALGLEHEHQRPDRDKFIQIQYHNVDPEKLVNFEKIPFTDVDLDHDYDYQSIMHYDATAFGRVDPTTKRPLVTMVPVKPDVRLMDNLELTGLDAQKLRILGKCSDIPPPNPTDDFFLEEQPSLLTNSVVENKPPNSAIKVDKIGSSSSQEFHRLICKDRSMECEKFRSSNFCSNYRYKTLMVVHCRNTCKFCAEPLPNEEEDDDRPIFENRINK